MKDIAQQMSLGKTLFGNRAETVRENNAGDALFAELVERQSRFVFRVVWAMLRNVSDAEDVAQETFLKLYRSGAWRQIVDERAFLARAAWRLAPDRIKANRAPEPQGSSIERSANPEQAAVSADWNAAIHRLVDALPEELRQPLALSAIDDLSSREIAEVMGISEGTVRTRLMRAPDSEAKNGRIDGESS
jgi:RNA polymerase sigma-70 factor (ECF subfamily)